MAQEPHLNIIRDAGGYYYVEVAQGADRITLTPMMASRNDADRALIMIRAATQLPVGRNV